MPLIPYPDVPLVPGVPSIARLLSPARTVAQQQSTQPSLASQAQQVRVNASPVWQLTDKYGNSVLDFDGCIGFEWKGESKIPNYPIENGHFSSYNKVATPYDARMTVVCNGRGKLTRSQFFSKIEELADSLDLLQIITPDHVYKSCNLMHADYTRNSRHGVSMITAQLWLVEIRTTAESTVTTSQPQGQSTQPVGRVAPVDATKKQAAAATSIQ